MAVRRLTTESGSDDFSVFHPAGFPASSDSIYQTCETTGSHKLKTKVGWFSRRPKGGGGRRELYEDENELKVSPRSVQSRSSPRVENNLPSSLPHHGSSICNFLSDCKRPTTRAGSLRVDSECEVVEEVVIGSGEEQDVLFPSGSGPVSAHSVFTLKEDAPNDEIVSEPAVDAVSPLVQSPVSVVPFIDRYCSSSILSRQGSSEYDHLEDFDPVVDGQMSESEDNSYVIALQLNNTEKSNAGIVQLPSRPTELIPVSPSISASIPGHLNLDPDLREADTRRQLFQWNSVSVLPTKDIPEGPCHCPSCCSCGSSLRRLTSSVRNGCEARLSFFSSRFLEVVDRRFPRQSCPLKRYGSDKSFAKQRLPLKSTSPLIQQRTGVAGHCTLQSAKKYSSTQVALEENVKATSLSGSGLPTDPDTHSMQSVLSTQSFATTASPSVYCDDHHTPYNKGVSGNTFKDRMEVRQQSIIFLIT